MRLLVTGRDGQLGRCLAERAAAHPGLEIIATSLRNHAGGVSAGGSAGGSAGFLDLGYARLDTDRAAAVIGLVQGGTQALSRSLFSQLIPAGKEAEYYGFYEISDRGTSWLGPLAFGLTYQLTGSYRLAIVSLVIFFVGGFIALALLPMRRAVVEAGNTPPERL